MTNFNNFGCVEADVLRKFATGSYTAAADDLGGSAAITDAMDDACDAVIQAMPEKLLMTIKSPEHEKLVNRATAGQTTCYLGVFPAVDGSLHLWAGSPQAFYAKPVLQTNPYINQDWSVINQFSSLPGSMYELPETGFTVNYTTGLVTLATALARNDQVYASYEIATTSLSIASLASVVADGAAAALGAKVYSQASAEWPYILTIADRFNSAVADIASGKLIPPELRVRQWWAPPQPNGEGSWGSVARVRG